MEQIYSYDTILHENADNGGAYVVFRAEIAGERER